MRAVPVLTMGPHDPALDTMAGGPALAVSTEDPLRAVPALLKGPHISSPMPWWLLFFRIRRSRRILEKG